MNLSERIKTIRYERRLNQRGLAETIGVTQQSYSGVENKPESAKLSTLIKVADALGVKLSFLVGETEINEQSVRENLK